MQQALGKPPQETNPYYELGAIVATLGSDEVRVLTRIADRMRLAQAADGYLHVAAATRTFRLDARDDIEDFLVYVACSWLKHEASR